ncbi:MAG TPA: hypothetical protein VFS39_10470 [Nitrospira sp.]|nr:hypothetical protein [Nitrospira sp.]
MHRRDVGALEVHRFMEVLPFTAVTLVVGLHWDQWSRALWSRAGACQPRVADEARASAGLPGLFSAIGLFIVLPYGEEAARCIRAAPGP